MRILLVEDSRDDAALVERELMRAGLRFTLHHVDDERGLIDALAAGPYDVVLSDFALPTFDGMRVLELVAERDRDLPVVVVTGSIGDERAAETIRRGAFDYVLKDKLARLGGVVEHAVQAAAKRREGRHAADALQLVGETTNDLLWDVDLATHACWLSTAIRRAWGYTIPSVVPLQWWLDHVHPDDYPRVDASLRAELAGTAPYFTLEYRFRRADGRYVEVLDRGAIVRDERGVATRMAGSMMDVSAAKRAEADLRASEARFRALVASMEEIVATTDAAGVVTGLYGRAVTDELRASVVGRCAPELIGDAAPAIIAAHREASRGASVDRSWSLPTPTGERHYHTYFAPFGDGGDGGVVSVTRDVTRQKTVEGQLLVADRMQSVGTLAAGLAHEINNPLAAVLTNLEYVQGTPCGRDEDVGAAIADAVEAAQRVRAIVKDLKIFSRVAEAPKTEPTDVRASLEATLRMAANEVRHKATVEKRLDPVPLVAADEARLGQVFLNLVVNAAQAIPDGDAAHHRIRVSTATDAQGRAVVEIADTGEGIPPHVRARLFTPFVTTKPVGSGTGLGLSICHRIVAQLGGSIDVETEVGVGSTFRVVLPPATAPTDQAAPLAEAASSNARRGAVLIVDDDPRVAEALRRVLSRDHDVTALRSGREALAHLVGAPTPDVVLCDVMMPDLTGPQLHDALLRDAPEAARRIVFMTGGAFSAQTREFLERTDNTCVEKPLDVAALRALVASRVVARA